MQAFLRDIALSFAPAWVRLIYRPQSPSRVLTAAIFTGIMQTILCAWWLLLGYKGFLLLRAGQYGHLLQQGSKTTQGWFAVVFFLEYLLFHPLALILSYMSLEGFVRFGGGLCVSEVIPSFPVVLIFSALARQRRKKEQDESQRLALIPDAVEILDPGERFRIATAVAKPTWNAACTVEIRGEYYEVERQESGDLPRSYVYLLRRAPVGKIRRGYERYDVPADL